MGLGGGGDAGGGLGGGGGAGGGRGVGGERITLTTPLSTTRLNQSQLQRRAFTRASTVGGRAERAVTLCSALGAL